nr:MAG TPA: Sigma24, RpoE, Transcriptional activator chrR sigma factor, anti-sigma factor [Caudoviricetes sp.]
MDPLYKRKKEYLYKYRNWCIRINLMENKLNTEEYGTDNFIEMQERIRKITLKKKKAKKEILYHLKQLKSAKSYEVLCLHFIKLYSLKELSKKLDCQYTCIIHRFNAGIKKIKIPSIEEETK